MSAIIKPLPAPAETYAAIDLGSNSFHMIVTRYSDGELLVEDRLREAVRLAAGLDESRHLTEETRQRALACLQRFGERIRDIPSQRVRAVGTNTLRSMKDAGEFLNRAEQALGHRIEVIAGVEEARLIYLGVAHGVGGHDQQRLVIDIGGGSTEMIIGKGFKPKSMESLHMGCVSYTQRFFPKGVISAKHVKRAELAARMELEPVETSFCQLGWEQAIGASGTIRSIRDVVRDSGASDDGITVAALKQLRDALLTAGSIDKLQLKGLTPERALVFPGGVIILLAAFKALGIERMQVSDSALREGLIHDLFGRGRDKDVRNRAVSNLARRYHVDQSQARRVAKTAWYCATQVAADWGLNLNETRLWLGWAAQLHEIGLDIAHSQYHKHGAYIAEFADLAGFSRQEQLVLAALIASHRRKFAKAHFSRLAESRAGITCYWAILLRLAVLLHRRRSVERLPRLTLTASAQSLGITFPRGWLENHQLTNADLEQEAEYLADIQFQLRFS